MKRLFSIIAIVSISILAHAGLGDQESTYKIFYKKYKGTPNTISFKIPGGLASFLIDKDDVEAKEFVKKMDDISFFIADGHSNDMIYELNKFWTYHKNVTDNVCPFFDC